MKINNVELEDIDILDADEAEKFENAIESVQEIENKLEGLKQSETIRIMCTAIFDVFNTLFGEGTDRKVFGDRVNLMICLKAFEELITQVKSKNEEIEKMASKYSPNRASRRKK